MQTTNDAAVSISYVEDPDPVCLVGLDCGWGCLSMLLSLSQCLLGREE